MLFKVTKEDIFKDNPELLAVEAFAKCTDRQLKYVFLTYDYKSPLRMMEINARKEKALKMAGYKMEKDGSRLDRNARKVLSGNVVNINTAIKEFMEVQRDVDREALLAIESQVEQIVQLAAKKNKELKELEMSVKLIKELPRLAETKKELIKILDIRDTAQVEEEDTSTVQESQLSTLDRLNAQE